MIRRKLSLILAAAMILSLLSAVYLPASARPLNGKTTEADTPASFEDGNTVSQKPTGEPYEPLPPQKSEELFFTKTKDNGDGTKTLELYGYPVSYRTKDGEIKDISLELKREGKGFRSGEHFVNTKFPEKIGEGITLKTDNLNIKITPVEKNIPDESIYGFSAESGAAEGKEERKAIVSSPVEIKDGKQAVYRTDGKTSYEYELTYTGYKENIVVSEYTGQTDYFFTVYTNGLKLERENKEGSRGTGLVFVDESGIVAKTDDIIVCSADNRNNVFGEISVETVCENEEYVICIHVPEEYLSDPETHYPIYIDPTISVAYNSADSSTWNDIEDITLNQNAATDSPASGTLYVGRAVAAYGAMRSVMRFPELELYGISPSNITSASLYLRDLMCYAYAVNVDCYSYGGTLPTGAFTTSNMTWNGINAAVQYYESLGSRFQSTKTVSYNNGYATGHVYEFNVLSAVREWAQGRNDGTLAKTNQALVFKSPDAYEASTNEHFVCFGSYDRASNKPYMTVTYVVPLGTLTLDASEIELQVGEYYQLTVSTNPTGIPVTWTSMNTSVATVTQSGFVVGVSTGTVNIKASGGGTEAICTVCVYALEDGVYSIQNAAIANESSNNGYLCDAGFDAVGLTSYSSGSRDQLWLIKRITGTNTYTLNPLSKTTLEYSGTYIGLYTGTTDYEREVVLNDFSDSNAPVPQGKWRIIGNPSNGYSIVSSVEQDYHILVTDSSKTEVILEYDENLIDVEEPVDRWRIVYRTDISYASLSTTIDDVSGYQDSKFKWMTYINVSVSNEAEQRIAFVSSAPDKITVTKTGIITIASNCPDYTIAAVHAKCGPINNASETVTAYAYGAFEWNMDYYVSDGRIKFDEFDERVIWLEDNNHELLTLSGTDGLGWASFSSHSFNHEWKLIKYGQNFRVMNVESNMVLKACPSVDSDTYTVTLVDMTNEVSELFRFERIGDDDYYIITSTARGNTEALAYNSISDEFYLTNRIETDELLFLKIREGGSNQLPSGYYCMGNPYISSTAERYFYLTCGNVIINHQEYYVPRLDEFESGADYPKWLLNYRGKGYYSISYDLGQWLGAITLNNGTLVLRSYSGDDTQLLECITANYPYYQFRSKDNNQYLMRIDGEVFEHFADVGPMQNSGTNWKMFLVKGPDVMYNYGNISDIAMIGIEDASHTNSHFLWTAKVLDQIYNRRNIPSLLYYESHNIKNVYSAENMLSTDSYKEILKNSRFIIHRGHGTVDSGATNLLLTPLPNNMPSGSEVVLSSSSLEDVSLNNCDCIIFFACNSAGENAYGYSTSMVKKAKDAGAKYVIGCQGLGYCAEFNDFITCFIDNIGVNSSNTDEYDYEAAFLECKNQWQQGGIRCNTVFRDSNGLTFGGD